MFADGNEPKSSEGQKLSLNFTPAKLIDWDAVLGKNSYLDFRTLNLYSGGKLYGQYLVLKPGEAYEAGEGKGKITIEASADGSRIIAYKGSRRKNAFKLKASTLIADISAAANEKGFVCCKVAYEDGTAKKVLPIEGNAPFVRYDLQKSMEQGIGGYIRLIMPADEATLAAKEMYYRFKRMGSMFPDNETSEVQDMKLYSLGMQRLADFVDQAPVFSFGLEGFSLTREHKGALLFGFFQAAQEANDSKSAKIFYEAYKKYEADYPVVFLDENENFTLRMDRQTLSDAISGRVSERQAAIALSGYDLIRNLENNFSALQNKGIGADEMRQILGIYFIDVPQKDSDMQAKYGEYMKRLYSLSNSLKSSLVFALLSDPPKLEAFNQKVLERLYVILYNWDGAKDRGANGGPASRGVFVQLDASLRRIENYSNRSVLNGLPPPLWAEMIDMGTRHIMQGIENVRKTPAFMVQEQEDASDSHAAGSQASNSADGNRQWVFYSRKDAQAFASAMNSGSIAPAPKTLKADGYGLFYVEETFPQADFLKDELSRKMGVSNWIAGKEIKKSEEDVIRSEVSSPMGVNWMGLERDATFRLAHYDKDGNYNGPTVLGSPTVDHVYGNFSAHIRGLLNGQKFMFETMHEGYAPKIAEAYDDIATERKAGFESGFSRFWVRSRATIGEVVLTGADFTSGVLSALPNPITKGIGLTYMFFRGGFGVCDWIEQMNEKGWENLSARDVIDPIIPLAMMYGPLRYGALRSGIMADASGWQTFDKTINTAVLGIATPTLLGELKQKAQDGDAWGSFQTISYLIMPLASIYAYKSYAGSQISEAKLNKYVEELYSSKEFRDAVIKSAQNRDLSFIEQAMRSAAGSDAELLAMMPQLKLKYTAFKFYEAIREGRIPPHLFKDITQAPEAPKEVVVEASRLPSNEPPLKKPNYRIERNKVINTWEGFMREYNALKAANGPTITTYEINNRRALWDFVKKYPGGIKAVRARLRAEAGAKAQNYQKIETWEQFREEYYKLKEKSDKSPGSPYARTRQEKFDAKLRNNRALWEFVMEYEGGYSAVKKRINAESAADAGATKIPFGAEDIARIESIGKRQKSPVIETWEQFRAEYLKLEAKLGRQLRNSDIKNRPRLWKYLESYKGGLDAVKARLRNEAVLAESTASNAQNAPMQNGGASKTPEANEPKKQNPLDYLSEADKKILEGIKAREGQWLDGELAKIPPERYKELKFKPGRDYDMQLYEWMENNVKTELLLKDEELIFYHDWKAAIDQPRKTFESAIADLEAAGFARNSPEMIQLKQYYDFFNSLSVASEGSATNVYKGMISPQATEATIVDGKLKLKLISEQVELEYPQALDFLKKLNSGGKTKGLLDPTLGILPPLWNENIAFMREKGVIPAGEISTQDIGSLINKSEPRSGAPEGVFFADVNSQFTSAVGNVISNAYKYSNVVNVEVTNDGGLLRIRVSNKTAPGMEMTQAQWDNAIAGVRNENATANSTGVGIPASKKIIEGFGGEMRLGDFRPGWTTIEITLPAAESPSPIQQPDASASKGANARKPSDYFNLNMGIDPFMAYGAAKEGAKRAGAKIKEKYANYWENKGSNVDATVGDGVKFRKAPGSAFEDIPFTIPGKQSLGAKIKMIEGKPMFQNLTEEGVIVLKEDGSAFRLTKGKMCEVGNKDLILFESDKGKRCYVYNRSESGHSTGAFEQNWTLGFAGPEASPFAALIQMNKGMLIAAFGEKPTLVIHADGTRSMINPGVAGQGTLWAKNGDKFYFGSERANAFVYDGNWFNEASQSGGSNSGSNQNQQNRSGSQGGQNQQGENRTGGNQSRTGANQNQQNNGSRQNQQNRNGGRQSGANENANGQSRTRANQNNQNNSQTTQNTSKHAADNAITLAVENFKQITDGYATAKAELELNKAYYTQDQITQLKTYADSQAALLGSSDPLSLLGLEPGATKAQIKKRYIQMLKALHPDLSAKNQTLFSKRNAQSAVLGEAFSKADKAAGN